MGIKTTKFHVTGMKYYQDDFFDKLAYENDDFNLPMSELVETYDVGERIYQYSFNDVNAALVPEPENEYDSNAVRVEVSGVKIGHIKKGSCSHVKNLLNSPDFSGVSVTMGGGNYKRLYEDPETEKIKVERDSCGYFADVEIYTRDDSGQAPAPAVVSEPSPSAPSVSHSPAAPKKKKSGALSIILIILGILFLIGGLGNLSTGIFTGFFGLIIGCVCLYFGIKRQRNPKQ